MFTKILIANRGEIACRVMKTCKRLGIATVAIYSDADAKAPHVTMADEAVRVGPAPVKDSYLQAEAIILAARQTGAQAIHPGYGLLSEKSAFARAVAEAGITFIGPPPSVLDAFGDKMKARHVALAAGHLRHHPPRVAVLDQHQPAVQPDLLHECFGRLLVASERQPVLRARIDRHHAAPVVEVAKMSRLRTCSTNSLVTRVNAPMIARGSR